MIVRQVTLRDVRSYASLELALEPGLVLVTGPNGAGKTNLLESVHVATQGFSFRTRQGARENAVEVRAARGGAALDHHQPVGREDQGVDLPPLLLLDDALSELDADRRRLLSARLGTVGQTLVTATGAEALPLAPAQLLAVSPGTVREA